MPYGPLNAGKVSIYVQMQNNYIKQRYTGAMTLPLRARWGFIFKCKTTTKIRGCYVPIIDTFASIKTKTTRLALGMSYPIWGPLIYIFVDGKKN